MSKASRTAVLAAALTAAVATAGISVASATTADRSVEPSASAPLGLSALTELREEERVARDLYQALATSSGSSVFTRIAAAETRHLAAVDRLLTARGTDPSTIGTTVGSYAVPELQRLYDGWLASGQTSTAAAFTVGVELETRDIADLEGTDTSGDPAASEVVSRLLAGSRRHLEAFSKAAAGTPPTPGSGQGPGAGRRGQQPGATQNGGPQIGRGPGATAGRGPGATAGRGPGATAGSGPSARPGDGICDVTGQPAPSRT